MTGSSTLSRLIPEFEAMKSRYPEGFESSLVLPCLRRIQADRGYVADEDIDALVAYLGVPRVQIEEVLSYYTQLRRSPIGRVHVEVCRNIAWGNCSSHSLRANLMVRGLVSCFLGLSSRRMKAF